MNTMASSMLLLVVTSTVMAAPLDELCQKRFMSVVTETFEDGCHVARWRFDARGLIDDTGGWPGAFLHSQGLETFAPLAGTHPGEASVFTGNYRAQGVFALTVDFKTFAVTSTVEKRPLSVVLVNHAGTPRDIRDDLYVYFVGPDNIPAPDADTSDGWVHYRFEIPSDSATLPHPRSSAEGEPGWVAAEGEVFIPAVDPDAVWNTVIEDVDRVIFWWHDPRYFAIFQIWDVGMDNPAVATCVD